MGIIDSSLGRYLSSHPEYRPAPIAIDPYAIARLRQLETLRAHCDARKANRRPIDPTMDFDFRPSR